MLIRLGCDVSYVKVKVNVVEVQVEIEQKGVAKLKRAYQKRALSKECVVTKSVKSEPKASKGETKGR